MGIYAFLSLLGDGKDGNLCSNPMENTRAVKKQFQKLYNIQNELDPTLVDQVRQRPVCFELDDPPTVEELRKALISAKIKAKLK